MFSFRWHPHSTFSSTDTTRRKRRRRYTILIPSKGLISTAFMLDGLFIEFPQFATMTYFATSDPCFYIAELTYPGLVKKAWLRAVAGQPMGHVTWTNNFKSYIRPLQCYNTWKNKSITDGLTSFCFLLYIFFFRTVWTVVEQPRDHETLAMRQGCQTS